MLWPHPPRSRPAVPVPEAVVAEPDPTAVPLVVQRPDGYYWLSAEGRAEVGPFASVAEAEADLNASADDSPEPGESLYEAEQELGIADWLDSETGELAEDTRTRIEDH
jgi:hypothetical protein